MTASCPMCGGKWDIMMKHFKVIMRCGDEHDVECYYCNRIITYVMDRENINVSYKITLDRYEDYISELELKIKETNALMEKIKDKMR